MRIFTKILLIVAIMSSLSFGASEAKVVLCNQMDAKYDSKVFRKVTILVTEARLKLQKKYRKYLSFEYDDNLVTDKKKIKTMLKKRGARYYVYLDIVDKSNGKCPKNKCKVSYIIKLYDAKKNKSKKLKIGAYINNNEFAEIKAGHMKSNTKKMIKFFKGR